MALIYCVKCKEKTDTIDKKCYANINGTKRISGKCAVCNKKKSQFIKS